MIDRTTQATLISTTAAQSLRVLPERSSVRDKMSVASATGLAASNRPANVFTEMVFLVEAASLRAVSLLLLEDFVLVAAVVANEESNE